MTDHLPLIDVREISFIELVVILYVQSPYFRFRVLSSLNL